MEFCLRCDCGQNISVAAGAAGTTVACRCGRRIAVPSLGELRRRSGLPAYEIDPALIIEQMLADGELPSTKQCVGCGRDTEDKIIASVACETMWVSEPSEFWWLVAFLFIGFWTIVFKFVRQREAREFGRNLTLHLPLPLCPGCRQILPSGPPTRVLGQVAVALVVAGLVAAVVWSAWGLVLVAVGVASWVVDDWGERRRQTALRRLLVSEPAYQGLLEKYPGATVRLSARP